MPRFPVIPDEGSSSSSYAEGSGVLPFSYFANYAIGSMSFPAISYNATSHAWTVTTAGTAFLGILTGDPDEQAILMNGQYVMFVLTGGAVQVGDITKNATANRRVPRLDFMRQAGGMPRKFASLDQNGCLNVFDVDEFTAPSGNDRMYLLGNANTSIGFDGLLTPQAVEIGLLVNQNSASSAGSYLIDETGKTLAVYP